LNANGFFLLKCTAKEPFERIADVRGKVSGFAQGAV